MTEGKFKLGFLFALILILNFIFPIQTGAQTVTTLDVIEAKDPAYTVGGTFSSLPAGSVIVNAFIKYGKIGEQEDNWLIAYALPGSISADRFEVILGGLETGLVYGYRAGITYKLNASTTATTTIWDSASKPKEVSGGGCRVLSARFDPSGFQTDGKEPSKVSLEVKVTDSCREKAIKIQILGNYTNDSIDIIEDALFYPTTTTINLAFANPWDQEGEDYYVFYWALIEPIAGQTYSTRDSAIAALKEKYEEDYPDKKDFTLPELGAFFADQSDLREYYKRLDVVDDKIDPLIKEGFLSYFCTSVFGFGLGRCVGDWEGLTVSGAFATGIDDDKPPLDECKIKSVEFSDSGDKTKAGSDKNPATGKSPWFQDSNIPFIEATLKFDKKCKEKTAPFVVGLEEDTGVVSDIFISLYDLFSGETTRARHEAVGAILAIENPEEVRIKLRTGENYCDIANSPGKCSYYPEVGRNYGKDLTYDCHAYTAEGELDNDPESKCDEPWKIESVEGAKIITDIGLQDVGGTPSSGIYTGLYTFLEPLPGLGPTIDTTTGIGDYVNKIITLIILIAGALAVIMITVAGIKWMLEESVFDKGEAKKMIGNALFGLVLTLASYMILNTINPNLVEINLAIKQQVFKVELAAAPQKPDGTYDYSYCKDGKAPNTNIDCPDCTTPPNVNFKSGEGNNKAKPAVSAALAQLKNLTDSDKINLSWQVTEAYKPTYLGHCSQCHYDGGCIDMNFKSDQVVTAQNIAQMFLLAKNSGFTKIQYEIADKDPVKGKQAVQNLQAEIDKLKDAIEKLEKGLTEFIKDKIVYVPHATGKHFHIGL